MTKTLITEIQNRTLHTMGEVQARNRRKQRAAKDVVVSAYMIEDIKTGRLYIGISETPLIRFSGHLSGKGGNSDFGRVGKERPEDLVPTIIEEFEVKGYKPKGGNSRAHMVESFLIAFYDTLRTGFNRKYEYNMNFKNKDFWIGVLPPKILKLYLSADPDKLNENVRQNLTQKMRGLVQNHFETVDHVEKDLAREYIFILLDKKIKVYDYAINDLKIDRGNLYRFLKDRNNNMFTVKKLKELISIVENGVGLKSTYEDWLIENKHDPS